MAWSIKGKVFVHIQYVNNMCIPNFVTVATFLKTDKNQSIIEKFFHVISLVRSDFAKLKLVIYGEYIDKVIKFNHLLTFFKN